MKRLFWLVGLLIAAGVWGQMIPPNGGGGRGGSNITQNFNVTGGANLVTNTDGSVTVAPLTVGNFTGQTVSVATQLSGATSTPTLVSNGLLSNTTATAIAYVNVLGNDATAKIGNSTLPWYNATNAASVAGAYNPPWLIFSPGTFTFNQGAVAGVTHPTILPTGAILDGAGQAFTILTTTNLVSTSATPIIYGTNLTVRNLTSSDLYTNATTAHLQAFLGVGTVDLEYDNLVGMFDGIRINSLRGTNNIIAHCQITSGDDAIAFFNGGTGTVWISDVVINIGGPYHAYVGSGSCDEQSGTEETHVNGMRVNFYGLSAASLFKIDGPNGNNMYLDNITIFTTNQNQVVFFNGSTNATIYVGPNFQFLGGGTMQTNFGSVVYLTGNNNQGMTNGGPSVSLNGTPIGSVVNNSNINIVVSSSGSTNTFANTTSAAGVLTLNGTSIGIGTGATVSAVCYTNLPIGQSSASGCVGTNQVVVSTTNGVTSTLVAQSGGPLFASNVVLSLDVSGDINSYIGPWFMNAGGQQITVSNAANFTILTTVPAYISGTEFNSGVEVLQNNGTISGTYGGFASYVMFATNNAGAMTPGQAYNFVQGGGQAFVGYLAPASASSFTGYAFTNGNNGGSVTYSSSLAITSGANVTISSPVAGQIAIAAASGGGAGITNFSVFIQTNPVNMVSNNIPPLGTNAVFYGPSVLVSNAYLQANGNMISASNGVLLIGAPPYLVSTNGNPLGWVTSGGTNTVNGIGTLSTYAGIKQFVLAGDLTTHNDAQFNIDLGPYGNAIFGTVGSAANNAEELWLQSGVYAGGYAGYGFGNQQANTYLWCDMNPATASLYIDMGTLSGPAAGPKGTLIQRPYNGVGNPEHIGTTTNWVAHYFTDAVAPATSTAVLQNINFGFVGEYIPTHTFFIGGASNQNFIAAVTMPQVPTNYAGAADLSTVTNALNLIGGHAGFFTRGAYGSSLSNVAGVGMVDETNGQWVITGGTNFPAFLWVGQTNNPQEWGIGVSGTNLVYSSGGTNYFLTGRLTQ